MSEVKPLDWGKTSYGTPEVFTVVGVYRLSHAQNGGWVAIRGHDAIRGADGRDNYATVADAEAAAQADYESRILSALTPTPSRNEGLPEYPWQDSETAPRDGSEFIARNDGYLPFSCHFWQEEFCHYEPDDGLIRYPFTSWMPIEATDPSALNAPSRDEVLEEAAKVAEQLENEWVTQWRSDHKTNAELEGMASGAAIIATELRALKSRGDHG